MMSAVFTGSKSCNGDRAGPTPTTDSSRPLGALGPLTRGLKDLVLIHIVRPWKGRTLGPSRGIAFYTVRSKVSKPRAQCSENLI